MPYIKRGNMHQFCVMPPFTNGSHYNGVKGDVWECPECGKWWMHRTYAWHRVTRLGRWWIRRGLRQEML